MSASYPSSFLVKVNGQIESGQLTEGDELYLQYFYHYGPDWKIERIYVTTLLCWTTHAIGYFEVLFHSSCHRRLESLSTFTDLFYLKLILQEVSYLIMGIEESVSQTTRRSEDERSIFVWNFPLDVTFKSTNPFGWPQIVIVLNGSDFLGKEIVRGYSACPLPIAPGTYMKKIKTFVPESASTLQKFVSWISGSRPEFVNPKTVAKGKGREVTRVRSQGYVTLSLNVVFKDFTELGYNCGHASTPGGAKTLVSSLLREPSSSSRPTQKSEIDENHPSTSRVMAASVMDDDSS